MRIKTRKVIKNFLTQIGILTLEKKLRRRAQFVNELALVRSAWQVKITTVKVRTVKVRPICLAKVELIEYSIFII